VTEAKPQEQEAPKGQDGPKAGGFWGKYRDYIILGALYLWLALLTIGVIAEIFDIQSILDWWIWKPPGKP
jgi:hypothetical protein